MHVWQIIDSQEMFELIYLYDNTWKNDYIYLIRLHILLAEILFIIYLILDLSLFRPVYAPKDFLEVGSIG